MSNFASILKAEVLRLARKEVRRELEGYRKATAQQRTDIAELKRQVAVLGKQVSRLAREPSRPRKEAEGEERLLRHASIQRALQPTGRSWAYPRPKRDS